MNNSEKVNIPKNIEDLKEVLKLGIENFQGSPVVNKNKLNESLAYSLGFDNYDQLSANLKKYNSFKIELNNESDFFINGEKISHLIFEEEMHEYFIINRIQRIHDIYGYISDLGFSEHDNINRKYMQQSLDFLISIDDDYLYESNRNGTDLVACSDDPEKFNDISEDILSLNKDI